MPDVVPLNEIQQWFQRVISSPDGTKLALASHALSSGETVSAEKLERVILRSESMTSLDRLQIYSRAYFLRLIECLRAEFPAVRQAIGDEAFDGLGIGYLIDYPSTSYTLANLGASFDEFLERTRPATAIDENEFDFASFLIELARLERIYSEVFHARGPETAKSLLQDDLNGLRPEVFADSRLTFHPSVRLVQLQYPVHEYVSAIRQNQEPQLPESRPAFLVVTRRNYIVRRFEVDSRQFHLLERLVAGSTVIEALQSLRQLPESAVASETLAGDLHRWFRDWSSSLLFAGLVQP